MTEGWWKYAYVGQKVVCVEAPKRALYDLSSWDLKVGNEYEISDIFVTPYLEKCDGVGFYVVGGCHRYGAVLFRPAITKSTDTGMRMIKKILDKANTPVKEPA